MLGNKYAHAEILGKDIVDFPGIVVLDIYWFNKCLLSTYYETPGKTYYASGNALGAEDKTEQKV